VIYKRNQIPSYPNLNFPVNDVPFGNPADNCVSVKFTNRGNITAIRVSVTAQTLRIRDLSYAFPQSRSCGNVMYMRVSRNGYLNVRLRIFMFPLNNRYRT